MNRGFYRVWLPASLCVHLGLLMMCAIIPISVQHIGGDTFVPITLVAMAVPTQKVAPIMSNPPVASSCSTAEIAPRAVRQLGEPRAKRPVGAEHGEVDDNDAGPEQFDNQGSGTGHTAPPALMRSLTAGNSLAPPGQLHGVGNHGDALGPSAPTRGARARFGRKDGVSKRAGEINVTAVARYLVQLERTGEVSSVTSITSTGNEKLDALAETIVRTAQYVPATSLGIPIAGSVQMQVEFHDGAYSIEEVNEK